MKSLLASVFALALFAPSVGVAAAAPPTANVTLTIIVGSTVTLKMTCATPDPTNAGACDIAANVPVGTSVATLTATESPSGTPTLSIMDPSGAWKLSGNSLVTAVSPLPQSAYTVQVNATGQ